MRRDKLEQESKKEQKEDTKTQPKKPSPQEVAEKEEKIIDDVLKIEILELAIGYQLIKLADPNQGGDLLDRIKTMRRKMAADFGFLMPQVRIRDNLSLSPNQYQILLKIKLYL